MPYHRGAVLTNESISLRIVFTDDAGNLVDPDSTPVLYIYDQSVDTSDIQEEIDAATFTSALSGPHASTQLSTGYYKYDYTVPSGATEGLWHDVWSAAVDGADVTQYFSFTVTQGANLSTQSLGDNMMLMVELDDSISNSDGDEFLSYTRLFYTTTYNPFYASPDLIRLELGPWVSWIPDDTLALMIHWSSKEADFIQGASPCSWANLQLARTKYVVYDAALRALLVPGQGSTAGGSSGKKKSLGDLSITDGGTTSTVADDETLSWLGRQREEWFRVLNAGGNIVPGQGLAPTMGVKGQYDPDRKRRGRQWADPRETYFPFPTTNDWGRRVGHRRYERIFGTRSRPNNLNHHYED